jgi:hypothetical protein
MDRISNQRNNTLKFGLDLRKGFSYIDLRAQEADTDPV